jgi:hypothetical protein
MARQRRKFEAYVACYVGGVPPPRIEFDRVVRFTPPRLAARHRLRSRAFSTKLGAMTVVENAVCHLIDDKYR